jgi:tRNA (guanine37-N1)-methyltransferase
MRIDVLTLFPEMFDGIFDLGIMKRAMEQNLVSIGVHNIRDYSHDKHHTVDDYPYGGGAGMVLKPEPIFEAVEAIDKKVDTPVILLSPQGRLFTQEVAQELAGHKHLVLICGRYEGVDERVREHLASDEISIGDYVLSGGELAAMVIMESVFRLVPGVLGSEESPLDDSHVGGLLEYPHYTRPPDYRGWPVPEVLLSGNHAEIKRWRREQSIRRTLSQRPELLNKADLSSEEERLLERLRQS